jgi:hypothetical protein
MRKFKNIIPYMLFEIASPIKPEKYDIDKENINDYDVFKVNFTCEKINYILIATIITYNKTKILYISFSTKDITDYCINNNDKIEYNELENVYSKETNINKPFSVLSNIIWLILTISNNENIDYFGFNTKKTEKFKIFDIYMKKFCNHITSINHPISNNEIIEIYKKEYE